ncbi:unnamed protein product [Brachionus calyciflorus]|uniref:Uncharacterized protein n=1 Tax=Brachionus calyciflorus TaxID=104777 RepID=A0A813MCQ3_9BILA|nr:unnamed protein product [Brachionus calyciflorus]
MTKQAEILPNSIQETFRNQIKKRDLIDKKIENSNLTKELDKIEAYLDLMLNESKSRNLLKDISSSSPFSSKTSYINIDYSPTSSSAHTSRFSVFNNSKKAASESNLVETSNLKFCSISSLSPDQKSSLLDISFSSSNNSQLFESMLDTKKKLKSNSNTSVTFISDYSDNSFMHPNKKRQDVYENGWIMKETIVKASNRLGLMKGSCPRKNNKKNSLSTLSFDSPDDESFKKEFIYPISLRYYHHLYELKHKKTQPVLYKKIIGNNRSKSSSHSNDEPVLINLINTKKTEKNERNYYKYLDLMKDLIYFNNNNSKSFNLSRSTSLSSSLNSEDTPEIKRFDRRKSFLLSRDEPKIKLNDFFYLNKKRSLSSKNSKSIDNIDTDISDLLDQILDQKNQRSKSELRNKSFFKSSSPPRHRNSKSRYGKKSLRNRKKYQDEKSSMDTIDLIDTSLDSNNKKISNELNNSSKEVKLSIDTKSSGGGLVTAEIKLNDKSVEFDLAKVDKTKYELKLLPKQIGEYKVFVYLNNQFVKGSPFLINVNSLDEEITSDDISSESYHKSLLKSLDLEPIKLDNNQVGFSDLMNISPHNNNFSSQNTSSISPAKSIKSDVFELSGSEDLIVGEEVKLNVKVIDYGNKKYKNKIPKIDTKVVHEDKMIPHQLDQVSDGLFQIKFLPAIKGVYNVFFLKDGQTIDGCPYKLNIKGRYLRSIEQPSYAQVGVPYILNVEYCNTTNLKAIVFTEKEHSNSLSKKNITKLVNMPVEKIIQNDSRISLKFLPLHSTEHIIDITDNGLSIEGFPIRINVFPNKEIFLINENINGLRLGSLAKFRIYLNGHKDSLNLRITNIDYGEGQYATFLLNDNYEQVNHVFGAMCKFLRINNSRIKNRELMIENGLTRVSFTIFEEENQPPNSVLIEDLKKIIETEKFLIIDQSLNKTIRALKNSFKFGSKGENVGFKLMKQVNKNFDYLGEFKPSTIGRYRIDVENCNFPIQNSPFFINVYNPSLVEIVEMPRNFLIGSESKIEINLRKAGFTEFELIIESPNGLKLPYKIDSSFNYIARFIAQEIGLHKVYMKFGDCLVNGMFST